MGTMLGSFQMASALERMVEAHTTAVVHTTLMSLGSWPVGVEDGSLADAVRSSARAYTKARACMARACMKVPVCMALACMMVLVGMKVPACSLEGHKLEVGPHKQAACHHRRIQTPVHCHNPVVAHLAQHKLCRAVPTT